MDPHNSNPRCWRVSHIKVCLHSFLSPGFPISDDKDVSLPPDIRRVPFTWEMYFLFSGRWRGWTWSDRESISAVSQLTLIQNNQYFTLTYFGMACLEPQHLQCYTSHILIQSIWREKSCFPASHTQLPWHHVCVFSTYTRGPVGERDLFKFSFCILSLHVTSL